MVVIEKVTTAVNLRNFHLLGPVPLLGQSPVIYYKKKHTELHHSSDSRESEVEGGKRCKQKIRNSGLASRKWMGVTAAMVPLGGLTVCGHAWEEFEKL